MLLLAIAAWLVLPTVAALGVTIRVPQDQPTIAAAITAARDGDDILIASGVYTESIYLTGYATAIRGTRIGTQATILRTTPNATGFAQPVIQGGASSATANERINEVTIEDIDFIPDPATSNGQAVASDRGNLRFVSCRFVGHKLPGSWSGIVAKIGGSLTLENCEFIGNVVGLSSAVVSHRQGSSSNKGDLQILKCRFEENSSLEGVTGQLIYATERNAIVSGSLIARNGRPNSSMTILEVTGGGKRIINSTIADNTCGAASALEYGYGANANQPSTIVNCIIWNNQSASPYGLVSAHSAARPVGSYSVVQGGYPGVSNLNTDPRFVDSAAGDYRLRADSPCIDAGNNAVVEIGDAMDFGGSPRFADVLNVPDNGVPSPAFPRAVIDIGPYEFVAPERCAADANHSGSVTADDLFIFLDQWFAQMGTACP